MEVVAVSATTPSGTARVEDVLLEVVLTDPDLLRAEFEAIIAASWPDLPSLPLGPAPPGLMSNPSAPRANQGQLLDTTNPGDPLFAGRVSPGGGRERSPPKSPASRRS